MYFSFAKVSSYLIDALRRSEHSQLRPKKEVRWVVEVEVGRRSSTCRLVSPVF